MQHRSTVLQSFFFFSLHLHAIHVRTNMRTGWFFQMDTVNFNCMMQILKPGSSSHGFSYIKSPRMIVKTCLNPHKALILKSCHSCLKEENLTIINVGLNSISFLTFFPSKIWSAEKGNFNLDLRHVTASEIKMRALNSKDNENLVYGYCWFQTMLSMWKKNSNASHRELLSLRTNGQP